MRRKLIKNGRMTCKAKIELNKVKILVDKQEHQTNKQTMNK